MSLNQNPIRELFCNEWRCLPHPQRSRHTTEALVKKNDPFLSLWALSEEEVGERE